MGQGFTCCEEQEKVWTYYPGLPDPICENRKNTKFSGFYIAETVLKIFDLS